LTIGSELYGVKTDLQVYIIEVSCEGDELQTITGRHKETILSYLQAATSEHGNNQPPKEKEEESKQLASPPYVR
jgi:hypothetical protein